MTDYLDPHFVRALCRDPERRTLQVSKQLSSSMPRARSGRLEIPCLQIFENVQIISMYVPRAAIKYRRK